MYHTNQHREDDQRINKQCGKWGHDWIYTEYGTKACFRLHCDRVMGYTPNLHGRRIF